MRRPSAVVVSGMLAAAVWAAFNAWLPGTRWVAVHLFTLVVLTPAIVGFTAHFAATLLATRDEVRPPVVLLVVAAVATLVAVTAQWRWLSGVAGSVVTAAVLLNYVRIRRARRAALQPRWTWMARRWERAHGAFVHGAILGILLAPGVLRGDWYVTGRLSHLHVNLLGFGGVTLLATSAMFAPMALRTRMEEDAPAVTARWSGRAATGVTVGVLALLASAVGGALGTVLRVLGGVGIGVFALAATRIAILLLRTRRNAPGRHWPGEAIVAAVTVLAAATWLDALVVATGTWRHLDALGVLAIAGGLLLAIVGALGAVTPWLVGQGRPGRDAVRDALDVAGRARVVILLLGTAVAATGADLLGSAWRPWLVRIGWGAVFVVVGWSLAAAVRAAVSSSRPSPPH